MNTTNKVTSVKVTPQTDGYNRAKRLWETCPKDTTAMPYVNVTQAFVTLSGNVQLCTIWKVGSHTLRRLFMLNSEKQYENLTNPYDIPWYHESPSITKQKLNNSEESKRYIFVRDPYVRLYAVYVDKVLAPNTIFWRRFGIPAILLSRKNPSNKSLKCGHDTTFSEYVKYVIAALTRQKREIKGEWKLKLDLHFIPYTHLCLPCLVKYDFIGKMEHFHSDVTELLNDLDLNATKSLLSHNGSELAAIDAIEDTVYQPFDPAYTKTLDKCLGRYRSLNRSWLKLKLRGLIGVQQLPVKPEDAHKVTYDQFLQMALNARHNSTKTERSILKNSSLKKHFNTLSTRDLQRLSEIYSKDLHYFEYDKIPQDLFV
ncbi:hypothetical protein ACF0H5_017481 [Mactra antiquata]